VCAPRRNERVLVTTLTKRMAEDLAEYFAETGVRCRYMHSEIDTLERVRILRDLRAENSMSDRHQPAARRLDLPEVSLVAILDADKEGYLRSATALIRQSAAARGTSKGAQCSYADRMTARWRKPSRKRTAAAPNRSPTTTPTTSLRNPSSSRGHETRGHRGSRLRHVPVEDFADADITSETKLGEVLAQLEIQNARSRQEKFEFERAAACATVSAPSNTRPLRFLFRRNRAGSRRLSNHALKGGVPRESPL